jgi:hypothetical protein
MKMNRYCIPLILIGICLAGCQSAVKENAKIELRSDQPLPEVSFFASYLSDDVAQQCQLFNQRPSAQQCVEDPVNPELYWSALKDSALFEQVHLSKDNQDYEILISSAGFTRGDRGPAHKQKVVAEISVTWRNIELKQYKFELPLLISNDEKADLAANVEFAHLLVSRFLQQTRDDGLFSAEFIYAKLKASDYQHELTIPENISDFQFSQKHQFADPLQGVMVRYLHPLYVGDVIDLYVYPIVNASWSDAKLTIKQELDKVSGEMRGVADSQQMAALNIGDMQELQWNIGDKSYKGYYLSADAEDAHEQKIYASTYIFVLNDKYIKFTATFPANIATDFIKQAVPYIKVPQESILMAELRKRAS